jgi:hypothetical protein
MMPSSFELARLKSVTDVSALSLWALVSRPDLHFTTADPRPPGCSLD